MTLAPMLARAADDDQIDEFINDDRWWLEPKCDGRRLMVVAEPGNVKALNREGAVTILPAELRHEFDRLSTPVTFDGEFVGSTLVLFDLPEAPGHVTTVLPFSERRHVLERLHEAWRPGHGIRLIPVARTVDEKIAMVEAVIAGRGEGLMAKRAVSPYAAGERSRQWRKIKRRHTIDCVVTWIGVEKANLGVGLYRDGELVDVGEVSRLTGDGERCRPGDVVEVTVLYTTEADRLYQPVRPMLRDDKRPEECTWDQLAAARTNKDLVLEMIGAA